MVPKGRKKARNGFSLPASGAVGREVGLHFGVGELEVQVA